MSTHPIPPSARVPPGLVRAHELAAPPEAAGEAANALFQGPEFARAACHEFYAAGEGDAGAAAGLALGLAGQGKRPLVWIRHDYAGREAGGAYAPGFSEFGLDPGALMLVCVRDVAEALQAGLEGARSSAPGAVLVELWGDAKALDLTASRRLALAAKTSGTPVFLLRMAARPRPSAAQSRWEVRAAPSRALAANAPGLPCFDLTLLHGRNGREGLRYLVEWDRDARTFIARASAIGSSTTATTAPLSGALVSFPSGRPGAAAGGPPPFRRAG